MYVLLGICLSLPLVRPPLRIVHIPVVRHAASLTYICVSVPPLILSHLPDIYSITRLTPEPQQTATVAVVGRHVAILAFLIVMNGGRQTSFAHMAPSICRLSDPHGT
ncbi:hypothetical protein BR93DRAFT_498848 [Coniochaeta sp. PMI_546]|nr:hypothetical protein BR93DRAFT_498848 [Coniochaeta sp. PMI_546]